MSKAVDCVYYLDSLMRTTDGLRLTAIQLRRAIEQSKFEFDSIAFRGFSGACIAPIVAMHMRKHITGIRKETSHSSKKAEGFIGGDYIVIDDLIDSGETLLAIHEKIIQSWALHHVRSVLLRNQAFGNFYVNPAEMNTYVLEPKDIAQAPKMVGVFLYHSARDEGYDLNTKVELFNKQTLHFEYCVPVRSAVHQ